MRFNEQNYSSKKYFLNSLITLYCKIIRVSWLQEDVYKVFVEDIVNITKEDNLISYLIPHLIYTELILQFQSGDLPPINK